MISFLFLFWPIWPRSMLFNLYIFVNCPILFHYGFIVLHCLLFLLLLLFTLQYCIGFAIYQHASAMGVHVFPILNPLSPPSPNHPSESSKCTSFLYPASNLDWRFISYVIYMFNAIIVLYFMIRTDTGMISIFLNFLRFALQHIL